MFKNYDYWCNLMSQQAWLDAEEGFNAWLSDDKHIRGRGAKVKKAAHLVELYEFVTLWAEYHDLPTWLFRQITNFDWLKGGELKELNQKRFKTKKRYCYIRKG